VLPGDLFLEGCKKSFHERNILLRRDQHLFIEALVSLIPMALEILIAKNPERTFCPWKPPAYD